MCFTGFGSAAKVEAVGKEPYLNHEALHAHGAVLLTKPSAFRQYVESGYGAASAYLSAPPNHAFSGQRHTWSVLSGMCSPEVLDSLRKDPVFDQDSEAYRIWVSTEAIQYHIGHG